MATPSFLKKTLKIITDSTFFTLHIPFLRNFFCSLFKIYLDCNYFSPVQATVLSDMQLDERDFTDLLAAILFSTQHVLRRAGRGVLLKKLRPVESLHGLKSSVLLLYQREGEVPRQWTTGPRRPPPAVTLRWAPRPQLAARPPCTHLPRSRLGLFPVPSAPGGCGPRCGADSPAGRAQSSPTRRQGRNTIRGRRGEQASALLLLCKVIPVTQSSGPQREHEHFETW